MQAIEACFVITSIVAAAEANNKAYAFVTIWTMLLQAAYVTGLYFGHKQAELRSAFAVGFMAGVSIMMAMANLTLAVLSGSSSAEFGGIVHSQRSSEVAVLTFSILAIIAELFLTALLLSNLGVLVAGTNLDDAALNPDAPPLSSFVTQSDGPSEPSKDTAGVDASSLDTGDQDAQHTDSGSQGSAQDEGKAADAEDVAVLAGDSQV